MLSAYGPAVLGGPLTYGEYVGLYMNLPRVRLAGAGSVAWGVLAAGTGDDLPDSLFDAMIQEPAEAHAEAERVNFERRWARTVARHGRG